MRFFSGQVLSSVPLGYVFSRMGVVIHPQPTDFQSSVFLFGKHTMTLLFFFGDDGVHLIQGPRASICNVLLPLRLLDNKLMIELSNVESHNLFHFPFDLDRRPLKIESNSKGRGRVYYHCT